MEELTMVSMTLGRVVDRPLTISELCFKGNVFLIFKVWPLSNYSTSCVGFLQINPQSPRTLEYTRLTGQASHEVHEDDDDVRVKLIEMLKSEFANTPAFAKLNRRAMLRVEARRTSRP